MTHVSANVINDAFRYYDDDVAGGITSQTALAAVDTNISIGAGVKFHVALLATETAGGDANNYAYSVEYRKNGGTWTDLTTTTSDPVYAVTADNCTTTDNASYGTTALTTGATIQATEYCSNGDAAANTSLNNASFEKTSCVVINQTGNAVNDTFEFRLTNNGTALNSDTTIGVVTVNSLGTQTFERTAQADGTSTATAAATVTRDRAVAPAATSAVKAIWTTTTNGNVSFDATPEISGTMEVGQTLTVSDVVTYEATATMAGTSTVAATGTFVPGGTTHERTATIAGTSTVSASIQSGRSVAISAASTLSATATRTLDRAASVTGQSTVAAVGTVTLERTALIAATSTVTAIGSVTGGTTAPPHRIWRVEFTEPVGGTVIALAELDFVDSGGSSLTGSGTWTASNEAFGVIGNAQDGNPSTFWATNNDVNHWAQFDAGSGSTIEPYGIKLRSRDDGAWNQAPAEIIIRTSDDGGTTFDGFCFIRIDGVQGWTIEKEITYALPETVGTSAAARHWGIFGRDATAGLQVIPDIEFLSSSVDVTDGAGGTAFCNPDNFGAGSLAFDSDMASYAGGSGIHTLWTYDFGSGNTEQPDEFSILARGGGNQTQTPIRGFVARSDDGETFVAISDWDAGSWSADERKTFSVTGAVTLERTALIAATSTVTATVGGNAIAPFITSEDAIQNQASLDNATFWATGGNVTVTANGFEDMYLVENTGGIAPASLTQIQSQMAYAPLANTVYTYKVDIKQADAGAVQRFGVYSNSLPGWYGYVEVSWSSGVPSTSASSAASNISYTLLRDGIYRLTFDLTVGSNVTNTTFQMHPDRGATVGNGFYARNPQLYVKEPEATEVLTVDEGEWYGTPSYSYQWNRNGSPIGGATSSTYTVVSADEGQDITVDVTSDGYTVTSNALSVPGGAVLERTAAITSASTVTAASTQTRARTAAIQSDSTVAATATVSSNLERTAAIASASTVTAASTQTRGRAAAIQSDSTVTAARTITRGRTAAITSASTVTATAGTSTTFERTAAITSTSSWTGNVTLTRYEVAATVSTSTVSATRTVNYNRTAAIVSTSTVTALTAGEASAAITSASYVKANWTTTTNGNVAFNAVPEITGTMSVGQTLTVSDAVTYQASAAITSASIVTATAGTSQTFERTAAIASASTVAAASTQTRARTAAIASASTVTAASTQTRDRSAAIASTSTVTAAASVSGNFERSAAIASASTVTAAATRTLDRAAAIASASTVTASGTKTADRSATITSTSTVTALADVSGQLNRTANITSASTVTADRTITVTRTAAIVSASTVTASAGSTVQRAANINSATTVTANRGVTRNRSAAVASGSTVQAVRILTRGRSVAIVSASTVAASRERVVNRAANVATASIVTATYFILGQSGRRVEPPLTSENSGTLPAARGGTLNNSLRTGTVGRGS